VTELIADAIDLQRAVLRAGDGVLQALGFVLVPGRDGGASGDGDGLLTPDQRQRIRLTVWQLQNAFETVAHPQHPEELREALTSLSYLVTTFGDRILVWTDFVHELVEEAERLYGTAAGRGAYKRQQIRGAVLVVWRRLKFKLPLIPSLLEPIIVAYAAQVLADFIVAHLNDNGLWDFKRLPAQPSLRVRLEGTGLYYLYRFFEAFSGLLTGLAWRLVMSSARLSPQMQKIVDRAAPDVTGTMKAIAVIGQFVENNPDYVRALARIFSIATQEAERFSKLSGRQKQAYAHDLIFAFLEQNGLVASSGLWSEIVSAWIKVAIDATVRLFNRRGLFKHASNE
jgi:hypothetical protein